MSDTPKINGVLAAYSYGIISGRKTNPQISKEVCAEKGANDDAGIWSDRLFPPKACGKQNSYTSLRKHLGQVRQFHYQNTYIFDDVLWRILPEKRIEPYKKYVEGDAKDRAYELLNEFIADLPNLIDKARAARGDAFKLEDYPTPQEIRSTFVYEYHYRSIPTGAGLNPAVFQEAINEINELHARRLQEANETLIRRFIEPLRTLGEQLADPNKKKIKTVLESIMEISGLVPTLDLGGNAELVQLAQSVNATFQNLTPEMIRQDEEVQKLVKQTCGTFVEKLGNFGKVGERKFA